MTACYIASMLGCVRLVRQYIGQVHERCDIHKTTCLHAAVAYNRLSVVRILLKHGADPLAQDDFGTTPLHYAVCYGSLVLTLLLLQYCTTLPPDLIWHCIDGNNCDVYDLLMEHNLLVNQVSVINRLMTPLHRLVLNMNPDIDLIKKLWPMFGEMENFYGETAELLACRASNVKFLRAIHEVRSSVA